jgi:hypothetical protein
MGESLWNTLLLRQPVTSTFHRFILYSLIEKNSIHIYIYIYTHSNIFVVDCVMSWTQTIYRHDRRWRWTKTTRLRRRWAAPTQHSRRRLSTPEASPFRSSRTATPRHLPPASLCSACGCDDSSPNSCSSGYVCDRVLRVRWRVLRVLRVAHKRACVRAWVHSAAAALHDPAVLCVLLRVRHQQRHLRHARLRRVGL